ncbi:hypothetical protein MVEG_10976 [Podila verticillata NRRL 6337]|uniref:DDE Tnp4 domain-containing protein n=1 Tax=Podila verticillata NRRL 6337 TaxID=1069443 RepID=A0A086TLW1_9FUNG|nr:hypothetical protein MVEG_10976 [Podila verticillata NRRL 6337]
MEQAEQEEQDMASDLSDSSDSDSDCSESENDDDNIADLMEEMVLAESCRYLQRPGMYRKQVVNNLESLQTMTEHECRSNLRMSWASFDRLLLMIADHEVFQSHSNRKQEPVAVQLALALDRLGHYGNGMNFICLSTLWHRSEGSCINFTNRVVTAILSLSDQFAAWPSTEYHASHSEFMSRKGFSGCVGFVDGTTIPLFKRPDEDGDFYYDRHGDYSLNLQVVCTANRWISFAFTGYSGRCHDHSVYTASDIWRFPTDYFSPGEYLVADSAYPISIYCMPVIKGAGLTQLFLFLWYLSGDPPHAYHMTVG